MPERKRFFSLTPSLRDSRHDCSILRWPQKLFRAKNSVSGWTIWHQDGKNGQCSTGKILHQHYKNEQFRHHADPV